MELIINSELSQRIEDIDFSGSSAADSELVKAILLLAHPVGSYYWSEDSTNPADLFGGTWVQIKDKFIIAVGDNHTVGTSYGSNTKDISHTHSIGHTHGVPGVAHTHTTGNHTLTVAEMPSHTHSQNAHYHAGLSYASPDGGGNTCVVSTTYDSTGCIELGWSRSNTGYPYDNVYTKYSTATNNNTGGGGTHNHGNTGSTTPSSTTTNSQSTSTSGSGGSTALDITPACIAAYCWRRTA